jgi:7-cyano-7-deazaguanine synthase in queuosine biosynthesis
MSGVLLLSGGLDSAVLAHQAEPGTVALHVNYGQPARNLEAHAARRVAQAASLELVHASARLDGWVPGPEDRTMLVPGRNLVLLAMGAALARTRGVPGVVTIGANADDQVDYPDCRPAFFTSAERALGCLVHAPLLKVGKQRVGDMARELGVPDTWSCYFPNGGPCGACSACQGRRRAGW